MSGGSKKLLGGGVQYNGKCKSSLLSHPSLFPFLYKSQTNSGKLVLYLCFRFHQYQLVLSIRPFISYWCSYFVTKHWSLIVPRAHEENFGHAQKMSLIQVPNRYNTTGYPKRWTNSELSVSMNSELFICYWVHKIWNFYFKKSCCS